MFHAVLASERPDVRVLSYAPGPLDTDMQAAVRSAAENPKTLKPLNPQTLKPSQAVLLLYRTPIPLEVSASRCGKTIRPGCGRT